jgi:hypothetical protein
MTPDSGIRRVDAEDVCAMAYPSRREALAVAHQLRTAGWLVIEHPERGPRHPGGVRMIASVYHPMSYESPGDLHASTSDEGEG